MGIGKRKRKKKKKMKKRELRSGIDTRYDTIRCEYIDTYKYQKYQESRY